MAINQNIWTYKRHITLHRFCIAKCKMRVNSAPVTPTFSCLYNKRIFQDTMMSCLGKYVQMAWRGTACGFCHMVNILICTGIKKEKMLLQWKIANRSILSKIKHISKAHFVTVRIQMYFNKHKPVSAVPLLSVKFCIHSIFSLLCARKKLQWCAQYKLPRLCNVNVTLSIYQEQRNTT